jgi:hypothetical protein
MTAISVIPTIIASIALAYSSFIRDKRMVIITFVIWFLLFVYYLNSINFFG